MKNQQLMPQPKTAILLFNLGGPGNLDEVEPFLRRLFSDHEIIPLPMQTILALIIARFRAPRVKARYSQIGGGSPLLHWTTLQGKEIARRLDIMSPDSAPHASYTSFRYANPSAADALLRMKADGVQRVVLFSQYPQFSCATTGSNINEVWREARRLGLLDQFEWSIIDRWPEHPGYVQAMAEKILESLQQFSDEDRGKVCLIFSAHSLPISVVKRGDPYPQEVADTVREVIKVLQVPNPYEIAYQSAAGPVKWLTPSTEETLMETGRKHLDVLLIPITFVNDHIETLHEMDIEFRTIALNYGIRRFERVPALNDSPRFLDAMADLVYRHISLNEKHSTKYAIKCPGCRNPDCRPWGGETL